jgi:hypothetical protein
MPAAVHTRFAKLKKSAYTVLHILLIVYLIILLILYPDHLKWKTLPFGIRLIFVLIMFGLLGSMFALQMTIVINPK